MGFGKKMEDPEPWRCRRTDGKKWRCAKEAFPDSKYCERHMHRGKNRSRKPVENPNHHLAMVKPYATYSDSSSNGQCRLKDAASWRSTQLGLSFGRSYSSNGEREEEGQSFVMGKDIRGEKIKDGVFPSTQLSISMAQYDKSSWIDSSRSAAGN